MRSARAAALVAVILMSTWSGPVAANDRATVVNLLTDPAAFDNRDVAVEGVVGASQWLYITVLGNPPYQGWFPAFILSDGPAALWVVVRTGPAGPATIPGLTVPPTGVRVEIRGKFWAVSRTIEMNQPSVQLR